MTVRRAPTLLVHCLPRLALQLLGPGSQSSERSVRSSRRVRGIRLAYKHGREHPRSGVPANLYDLRTHAIPSSGKQISLSALKVTDAGTTSSVP